MNIQLFLEDQEVELNSKVAFPLNKSYENLWNPTDILVEYSKSINIPATAANNKLMSSAYRLDRQYVSNYDEPNIGMYLDPLKRIPMKLIYNGSILLDGYAKYNSATVSDTNTYYTFNLYGALGDVFQKLLDCVFDENKLTEEQRAEHDNGRKYVIDTPWEPLVINKDTVKRSWQDDIPNMDYKGYFSDNIGFAPAYRGFYDEFESNSALGLGWKTVLDGPIPTEPVSVEDTLKEYWKRTLENEGETSEAAESRVDQLDMEMLLPGGLNEHNLRQFRSYEQKPYIYFYALMNLYRDKCKELTGYTINLDPTWFSANNPYWSRLCYMLDYLSVRGNTLQGETALTGYAERQYEPYSESSGYPYATATYNITDDKVLSYGNITTRPFTICCQNKKTPFSTHTNTNLCEITLAGNSAIFVEIVTESDGKSNKTYFWGGNDLASAKRGGVLSQYKDSNFITVVNQSSYDSNNNKVVGGTYITIPEFTIPHEAGKDLKITFKVTVKIYRPSGPTSGYSFAYRYNGSHVTYMNPVAESDESVVIIPNTQFSTNWRNTTVCSMKNLYSKDESLFKVVLQYTKMFGLIWKPNYNNKTIDILTRKSYFKDYTIVDWTNKVNKAKGMTISPVSFDSNYVSFNYKDTDGYRYSGYKNKYGVDYGEKRLKTRYNFDTKTTELFKDNPISPSSASCKSYTSILDLLTWNTKTQLGSSASEIDFIDCENDDQQSSISLNNWYFRNYNRPTEKIYYLADVSDEELSMGKYFWVGTGYAEIKGYVTELQFLPQFSPAFKSDTGMANMIGTTVGCLFNCPNDDYTKDKTITEAKGNYIYDNFWADYINERYNANNKKLVCYVKLTPIEFEQFNYKTFINIDNQLFVLNKILDFDVTELMTKIELVQVSDINCYINQKLSFPAIAYDASAIYITTKSDSYGSSGSGSITFSSYPSVSSGDYTITTVSTSSSKSLCFVEDAERTNSNTTLYITYESDGVYTEEFLLTVTALGETINIPIYVNG